MDLLHATEKTGGMGTLMARGNKRPSGAGLSGYVLTDADRTKRLGKIQRQMRRCLIAAGTRGVRLKDVLAWTGKKPRQSIHRAAKRVAVVIRKDGRGVVWGLKSPAICPVTAPTPFFSARKTVSD